MPRNVWLLMLAQALNQSSAPLVVLVGGLIGSALAPSPQWVTLPIALMVVGTALGMLPVSLAMQRWGRKPVFLSGNLVAMAGAATAAFSIQAGSFAGFCVGTFLIGNSLAIVQQYRFAAMESVDIAHMSRAASRLLLAGLLAALIGPELGVRGQGLLATPWMASFLGLIGLNALALLVLLGYHDNSAPLEKGVSSGRALSQVMRQPVFWVAVGAGAIGYMMMSFIMTATPVSMHVMQGHSLADTKWVIQSHIFAMFLPSLFSGWLISRFGVGRIMLAGCLIYLLCIGVAGSGVAVANYWLGLVLLGIGWNFLFVGGTTLLPRSYTEAERFRVQGFNEVIVFGTQALASLSAGWVLTSLGWQQLLTICVPVVCVQLLLLWLWRRSDRAASI